MRVETITWLPYPQNKPDVGKTVLCSIYSDNSPTKPIIYVPKYIGGNDWRDRYGFTYQSYFEGYRRLVTAYAELPKGYTDSPTFNFLTALALLKAGIKCKSIATDINYYLNGVDLASVGGGYNSLNLAEIEGEWELA